MTIITYMGFLDLIFPKNCLECGESGGYLCQTCLSVVAPAKTKYFKIGELSSIHSIFEYRGVVRKVILKLKYNFASDISDELASAALPRVKSSQLMVHKNAVLVPIPLHENREKWRGFNQANLLGERVSTGLDWEIEQNLLTRTLASKRQVGLSKNERLRNISGKFAVNEQIDISKYHKKPVILFDDVWTTGATMREACKTLKRSGFENIHGLTICG